MQVYASPLLSALYSKGSTSISSAEQGLTSSKFASTEGCRIPRLPSTISRLQLEVALELPDGSAAFRFSAMVCSAPPPVPAVDD